MMIASNNAALQYYATLERNPSLIYMAELA